MGKVRSEKMFVLGFDGMDPRLTKKYVEMGIKQVNASGSTMSRKQQQDLGTTAERSVGAVSAQNLDIILVAAL